MSRTERERVAQLLSCLVTYTCPKCGVEWGITSVVSPIYSRVVEGKHRIRCLPCTTGRQERDYVWEIRLG